MDVKSRYVWTRLIKKKSDAVQHVIDWNIEATTQTGRTLKRFHSDGGGEYVNEKLKQHFYKQGTIVNNNKGHSPT